MSARCTIRLNKIFKDHRKEALVNINSNFKQVIDFEKHIQNLFNIQSRIYLTIGGCLLPSQECVQVIQSGDVIIVNKIIDEQNNGIEGWTPDNSNELDGKVEIEKEIENESIAEGKRRKRIRKRKCKQNNDEDIQESSKCNKLLVESEKMANLSLTNEVDASPRKANSHIRFSDGASETDVTLGDGKTSDHLDTLQSNARVIRPVMVLTTGAGTSAPPEDQEVGKIEDTKQDNTERLISLKQFANDTNFAKMAVLINFKEIIQSMETSKEFVDLKNELKTYDIVGFKMLKIGKNYQPELSEWMVAMVKDIEDSNITLHLLAGKEETACPEGKLSMEIDEAAELSDLLTLNKSDMLNVKVFVATNN